MYARDWLSGEGTSMMLPEQEGAFIRLLCVAWGDGASEPSLPDDDRALAEISRLRARWKKHGPLVRAQFTAIDGRLYNDKLSRVWNKQRERSQRLAENGRKGGRARAGLEPGLNPEQANVKHTEEEAESETELSTTHAWVSELASGAKAALGIIAMRSSSRAACLASLGSMLSGNDPATPQPTVAQFGQALCDFAGGAHGWNAAHFRGYLKRAVPRTASLTATPTGNAALMLQTIRELAQESQQPGQAARKFIPKAKVEALGADVFKAYQAIGGADRILNSLPGEISFVIRDFTQALDAARAAA